MSWSYCSAKRGVKVYHYLITASMAIILTFNFVHTVKS